MQIQLTVLSVSFIATTILVIIEDHTGKTAGGITSASYV